MDCSDFEQIMVDAADKISTIPALQAETRNCGMKWSGSGGVQTIDNTSMKMQSGHT